MTLAPGKRFGTYEIISAIGAGGMGEVWRARDIRLNREVAIKVLPSLGATEPDRLLRFEKEALATSALNHPNIVTIHELGEVEDARFIAMELVQGKTLRSLINTGPLSIDVLSKLGCQMAKALHAAHNAGITHRDIKPENIMVRDDGYVKVLDFGLARLTPPAMDKEAATLHHTQPGVVVGSAYYMSPEQARGENVGSASDIFSLGLVFYEMATGHHPFVTDSLLGTLNAIVGQAAVPPSRLNPEIDLSTELLIQQMLQKEERLRPNAAEVDRVLAGVGSQILSDERSPVVIRQPGRHTVGRNKAQAELHEALSSAFAGRGLLVCVPGEPGMGKTTLVEDFLTDLRLSSRRCIIARGRCSERLAGKEAYLPWLEALDGLLRGGSARIGDSASSAGTESFVDTTKRLAPSWYAQAVNLEPDDSSAVRLLAERAASQERMKREFGAWLQEVSDRKPVVLFFDDIQWADVSTIDLLTYLASKFDSMRVLIIATYRPSDLLLAKHPFMQVKRDLQSRGGCREIEIPFLSLSDIEHYLALEYPEHRFPPDLPAMIHKRTEGNPLFMADLVRYLRDRGVIARRDDGWVTEGSLDTIERDLPESVRAMVDRKVAQLTEEDRRLLTVASVQGYEFDSAVVARALDLDPADVEERLETLEKVYQLVRLINEKEFPGRVLTLRYRFVHVLYQNALFNSLRPTRRAQMSETVANALLSFSEEEGKAVASELAFLFESARQWSRAAFYYLVAANNALNVYANRECAVLAQRGLEMLRAVPESDDSARQELGLQITLGQALMVGKGFAQPEVEDAFLRVRDLSLRLKEPAQLFMAQFSLSIVNVVRAEYQRARDYGEQCLRLGEETRSGILIMQAHWVLGLSQCYLGQFEAARQSFEQAIAIHEEKGIKPGIPSMYGAVLSRAHLARMLLFLGYPDQSQKTISEAIVLAGRLSHPIGVANTLALASYLEAFRQNVPNTIKLAEDTARQADEHGLPYYKAVAMLVRGWALATQDEEQGIALIRKGIASSLEIGTRQQHGYSLALLAETLISANQIQEALDTIKEALDVSSQSDEQFYEAELQRLRGEAMIRVGAASTEIESCFKQAISTARQQKAKSFELRAVVSLVRFAQREGRASSYRPMLAELLDWFTEGHGTADFRNAKSLLEELKPGIQHARR